MTLIEISPSEHDLRILGHEELAQFNELNDQGILGSPSARLEETRVSLAGRLSLRSDFDTKAMNLVKVAHADAFLADEWEGVRTEGISNASLTRAVAFEVDSVAMLMLGKLGHEQVIVPKNQKISDLVHWFLHIQVPELAQGAHPEAEARAAKAALMGSVALVKTLR